MAKRLVVEAVTEFHSMGGEHLAATVRWSDGLSKRVILNRDGAEWVVEGNGRSHRHALPPGRWEAARGVLIEVRARALAIKAAREEQEAAERERVWVMERMVDDLHAAGAAMVDRSNEWAALLTRVALCVDDSAASALRDLAREMQAVAARSQDRTGEARAAEARVLTARANLEALQSVKEIRPALESTDE